MRTVVVQSVNGSPFTTAAQAAESGSGEDSMRALSLCRLMLRPSVVTCFPRLAFLVLLLLLQTSLGGGEWQTNTERVTAVLKSLPALPKPHFSRPFNIHLDSDHGPYSPSEKALVIEFARVTSSLPIGLGSSEAQVKVAVSIARAAIDRLSSVICGLD